MGTLGNEYDETALGKNSKTQEGIEAIYGLKLQIPGLGLEQPRCLTILASQTAKQFWPSYWDMTRESYTDEVLRRCSEITRSLLLPNPSNCSAVQSQFTPEEFSRESRRRDRLNEERKIMWELPDDTDFEKQLAGLTADLEAIQ